jgi:hypothetical protein
MNFWFTCLILLSWYFIKMHALFSTYYHTDVFVRVVYLHSASTSVICSNTSVIHSCVGQFIVHLLLRFTLHQFCFSYCNVHMSAFGFFSLQWSYISSIVNRLGVSDDMIFLVVRYQIVVVIHITFHIVFPLLLAGGIDISWFLH